MTHTIESCTCYAFLGGKHMAGDGYRLFVWRGP